MSKQSKDPGAPNGHDKDEPKNDAVGYGRPPKQHQFKPGVSGNPKGRPKGRKSESAVLKGLLDERFQVKESGRRKWMSKREALGRQALNYTLKGQYKNFSIYLALKSLAEQQDGQSALVPEDTRRARERRIADYMRRNPQGPSADDSEGET